MHTKGLWLLLLSVSMAQGRAAHLRRRAAAAPATACVFCHLGCCFISREAIARASFSSSGLLFPAHHSSFAIPSSRRSRTRRRPHISQHPFSLLPAALCRSFRCCSRSNGPVEARSSAAEPTTCSLRLDAAEVRDCVTGAELRGGSM